MLDFAENYSFAVQVGVQGFHWNNSEATLHPFVIYFKDLATIALNNMSLVCISDYNEHNSIAVYTSLKEVFAICKSYAAP